MTRNRQQDFRARLEVHRAELQNASGIHEDQAMEVGPEEMDRIQQGRNQEQALLGLEREARRRQEVYDALTRLDTGRFGRCEGCEQPIGLARLTVMPWAALCVFCQAAEERFQAEAREAHSASPA